MSAMNQRALAEWALLNEQSYDPPPNVQRISDNAIPTGTVMALHKGKTLIDTAELDALLKAATDTVKRWQAPAWIDGGTMSDYIQRLRKAVEAVQSTGGTPDIRISPDQWAELVARHPETMQVLFGGNDQSTEGKGNE